MGSKVKRSKALGQSLVCCNGRLKRALKWAAIGMSSLSAVCMGLLPAASAELSAWRYDSRSRSLTLTLPGTITPNVSVTAPDQLLLELPDTQVGDVRAQQVNDGFVEEIFLEQATPETVWMVVDFVPGTVLSDTQQVTPLAASSNTLQLWKVQPALIASRRGVEAAIATQTRSTEAGAAALAVETPGAIAQADFPDLPVLEPAAPLSQPVSVPPINASPVRVPPPSTAPTPSAPVAADPVTTAEPPFIGEVNVEVVEVVPTRSAEPIAFDNGADPVEADFALPTQPSESAGTSRWPEPIPFGQPLP